MPTQTFFNLSIEKQNRITDAALDEFSKRSFESASLSNIIKKANIPRGSLYQYFKDKKDILKYLMDLTQKKKMNYMSEALLNPDKVPFLVLFKELYRVGIEFAKDNEKLVKLMSHIVSNKDSLFDELLKDNLEFAKKFYYDLIELDKSRGRIKPEIDSLVFATIVRDMTVNISIEEFNLDSKNFNFERILERITQVIKIFEIGVKQGEYDV